MTLPTRKGLEHGLVSSQRKTTEMGRTKADEGTSVVYDDEGPTIQRS